MDQKETIKLKKFIEIEKKYNLWDYVIDEVHPWAIIRGNVLNISLRPNINSCPAHMENKSINYFSPNSILNFFKTLNFFISKRKNFDSLFFTTARYQNINKETSFFYDQFFKPYFSLFNNPLIFEHSYQGTVKRPRELESNTYLFDYIPILSTIKSLKNNYNYWGNDKDIVDFLSIVCDSFSLQKEMPNLYRKIIRRFHARQHLIKYIDNISLHMVGNKAFIHCASYLNDNGLITQRLRDNGIITIEIQHGFIGPNHYAYNYPTGHAKSIAKKYLPDYFLTYGKYWNEQIQTPSTAVTVGNPSLNAARDYYQSHISVQPKNILVVSQGYITHMMVKIAKYLSEIFPHYTVIFKLHPGELPFTERYEELKKYPNIQIKSYENIYELIASSEIIVGYTSTTLFEALSFKDKRIFIIGNNSIPESLGYHFSSFEELRDAILDESYGYPAVNPSYFWEIDWERKISAFLNQIQ
ncbi:hypothetical protein FTO68_11680 [Methanocalculus taiwanensis]|uniref:Capsule polysaccharide biosynthesis protein n=1 Tax=Methanocalculus taiwanensis TaxID=106207 RepID=A0ABD4TPF1_9EURY|nr:hypothetical protein [Methanocalculus taiwanensis]MCQ1539628.1 hypothetical protein [Methanocalculus taiwanensis]